MANVPTEQGTNIVSEERLSDELPITFQFASEEPHPEPGMSKLEKNCNHDEVEYAFTKWLKLIDYGKCLGCEEENIRINYKLIGKYAPTTWENPPDYKQRFKKAPLRRDIISFAAELYANKDMYFEKFFPYLKNFRNLFPRQ